MKKQITSITFLLALSSIALCGGSSFASEISEVEFTELAVDAIPAVVTTATPAEVAPTPDPSSVAPVLTLEISVPNVPGCDFYFSDQNLCATLGWVTEPGHDVEGIFRLYFWDRDQGSAQRPVMMDPGAASIGVKLWMPDTGLTSGLISIGKAKDDSGFELDGIFEATNVYFVTPGKWDIIIELKDESGNVYSSAKVNYQAN